MTTFRWTDRAGVSHELPSHDEIERERRQVRQELLDLRPRLESTDEAVFVVVHGEVTVLRVQLAKLQDDLRRFVRHEAARATTMIDQIEREAGFLRVLHRSYDQHDERAGDEAALAMPPTPEQMSVLRRQVIPNDAQAVVPATIGEAYALLLAHPATCRLPLPDPAPGFEWTDRQMHYHQVRPLRQIEREYVTIASELANLSPQLAPEVPIEDVLEALELSRLAVNRVTILERAMDRWTAHAIGVVRNDHVTFLDDLEKFDGRNV